MPPSVLQTGQLRLDVQLGPGVRGWICSHIPSPTQRIAQLYRCLLLCLHEQPQSARKMNASLDSSLLPSAQHIQNGGSLQVSAFYSLSSFLPSLLFLKSSLLAVQRSEHLYGLPVFLSPFLTLTCHWHLLKYESKCVIPSLMKNLQ